MEVTWDGTLPVTTPAPCSQPGLRCVPVWEQPGEQFQDVRSTLEGQAQLRGTPHTLGSVLALQKKKGKDAGSPVSPPESTSDEWLIAHRPFKSSWSPAHSPREAKSVCCGP